MTRLNNEFAQVCDAISHEPIDLSSTEYIRQLDWKQLPTQLLALGPNQTGPNILFSRLRSNCFPVFTSWGQEINCVGGDTFHADRGISLPLISYGKALLRGFQLATERGPLCAEPMRGVMFILEEICADDCCILDVPNLATEQSNNTETVEAVSNVTESESPKVDMNDTKVEALKRRRRTPRLTSISWLDESDDQFEEDSDFDSVGGWDWQSADEADHESHKSTSSNGANDALDDEACEIADKKVSNSMLSVWFLIDVLRSTIFLTPCSGVDQKLAKNKQK